MQIDNTGDQEIKMGSFKILNGFENVDRNTFFSIKKNSRTRGHEVALVINVD